MKQIIALLFLCINGFIFSQENNNKPIGMLEYDRSNVVYRNKEYYMYAIAHGGYDGTILEGKNVEIQRDSTQPYLYRVIFKDSTEANLNIVATHKGKRYFLSKYSFVVQDKPLPIVYINNIRSGNFIDKNSIKIEAKHPDELKIRDKFKVDSWEVIINNKQFTGIGDELSKDVVSEIELSNPYNTIILKVKTHETSDLLTGVFLIN